MSQAITTLISHLIDSGDLQALAGKTEHEIRAMYSDFTFDEQTMIYLNVQALLCTTEYDFRKVGATALQEVFVEAEHSDLDGWTDEQKIVIRAFLADASYAANNWN